MRFFLRRRKNRTSVRKLKNKCLDCLLHKTCFYRKKTLLYIAVCVLIIVVVFILQVKKYSKTKRRFRVGNLNVVDRAILVKDSLKSDDHRLTLKRNGSISIPCSIKAPCIWPKNSLKQIYFLSYSSIRST